MRFLRRVHLFAGLFLLPWVFLYGITGAMFNHLGLFPETSIIRVDSSQLVDSPLDKFPSKEELAKQVVEAIRESAPDATIAIDPSHSPEFTNDVMLQINQSGVRHVVHVDPVSKSTWVATFPEKEEQPKALLPGVRRLKLEPNPYNAVVQTVPKILSEAGIESEASPKPMGWSKLNFLATVDGQTARITYVLRDGHVDVSQYEGETGMSARRFFLRLHTSHGQSPHWNGRMVWSLLADLMALAMVIWGATGLLMWWQIKRTRRIGSVVIALSLASAVGMYFSMFHFYATTKL